MRVLLRKQLKSNVLHSERAFSVSGVKTPASSGRYIYHLTVAFILQVYVLRRTRITIYLPIERAFKGTNYTSVCVACIFVA